MTDPTFTTYVGRQASERYAVVEYREGEVRSLYHAELIHRADTVEEAVSWLLDTAHGPGRYDVVGISDTGHLVMLNPDDYREARDRRSGVLR